MIFSPRRLRRPALVLASVAAASLSLAACASGDEAASTPDSALHADSFGDLTVQLSWILNESFVGEYFADSEGYFEDSGFSSVNLVPGPSSGVAELVAGTADVAKSDAATIGAAVANEGAPLKIIGATLQENPFTVLSLADGADIVSPEDLIGKRIGVQDKNSALFSAFLAANDIAESDLTIVPVQYDPTPLVNGEVDGFVAFLTNEAITVAAQGVAITNLPFADNGLPFVAEAFVATDDRIGSDREMLKAFLVAAIRGWADAVADPEEGARLAIEVYGAELGLDPENSLAGAVAQNELIVSADTERFGLLTVTDELQAATIESLAGAGIDLTAADLFDLSLLAEVYEEHPELIS